MEREEIERLAKALEQQGSVIAALHTDLDYMKIDWENMEKSLRVMEKETKLQIETLTVQLDKLEQAQSSHLQAMEKKIDGLVLESENSVQSLRNDFQLLKFELREARHSSEAGRLRDLEEAVKNKSQEVEEAIKSLNDEMQSLKAENKKLQAEISHLKSDGKNLERKLEMKANRTDFLDGIFIENPNNAAIRDLYRHFPSGMCYFYDQFSGTAGTYKWLVCPKIKRNYIKRVPNWKAGKLSIPFQVCIGNRIFTITEYHRMSYSHQLEDVYYIVPEVFEDYYGVTGYDFLKRYAEEINITQSEIYLGLEKHALYAVEFVSSQQHHHPAHSDTSKATTKSRSFHK